MTSTKLPHDIRKESSRKMEYKPNMLIQVLIALISMIKNFKIHPVDKHKITMLLY